MAAPLLEVEDLRLHFETEDGLVKAVDGISYTVDRGETLGIVGESGSGKSVSSLTVMGLTRARNARISGAVRFNGQDLIGASDDDLRKILGLLIEQLNINLLDRRMKVIVSSEVIDWIIDITCKDRSYGARPLRRAIQRYIEDPLAEELIRGHLQGGEIEVYLEGGQLAYRPAGQPVVAGRRLTSNV